MSAQPVGTENPEMVVIKPSESERRGAP